MSEIPDMWTLATDDSAVVELIKQNGYAWTVGCLQATLRRLAEAVGKDSLECVLRVPRHVPPNAGNQR